MWVRPWVAELVDGLLSDVALEQKVRGGLPKAHAALGAVFARCEEDAEFRAAALSVLRMAGGRAVALFLNAKRS